MSRRRTSPTVAKVRTFLLDAKKAVGCATVAAGAAASAGLIDNAQAAEITGVAGAVSTVVVYVLDNLT